MVLAMARTRDYQAEYRRRLELGRQRGLTTAQARRGARKYATTPPREHVGRRRGRAAPRKVRGYNAPESHAQSIQRFHSLDRAMDFAAGLGPRDSAYIVGHGTFRVASQYAGKLRGWAALCQVQRPRMFNRNHQAKRQEIRDKDTEIFSPKATTYEVRWQEG